MRGKLLGAAAVLALLVAASWLPVLGAAPLRATPPDLGRAPLAIPAARPLQPRSATDAVRDFFLALADALAAQPAAGAGAPPQPAPAADQPEASGSGAAPGPADAAEGAPDTEGGFAAAYAYLDAGWRQRLPFTGFVDAWRPLRRLDLLADLAAGRPPFAPRSARVFVEVRTLIPAGDGLAVSYAYGFYLAAPDTDGWHLASGSLHAETFAAHVTGTAAEPAVVALAAARARAAAAGVVGAAGPVTLQAGAQPHVVTARLRLGSHPYVVRLYQLVDGAWVAVEAQAG